MAEQTAPAPNTVHLSVDGYEGPLDLLLELARRQRIDLARISVVALADQFVEAVTNASRTDLVQSADWLVMAAWLTWLKSRLLLPADPDESRQADQAQRGLTRRLVELERVRAVADWLDGQPQLGWDMFERAAAPPPAAVVPAASYVMLLEACLDVLRSAPARPAPACQPRRLVGWTPGQAMTRIQSMMDQDPRGGDLLGFLPRLPAGLPDRKTNVRVAIASTLGAGLEMARVGRVRLDQPAPFGPIAIEAVPGASLERRGDERIADNVS